MSSSPPRYAKVLVAVALTMVGGYVDVIGWLVFDHVFLAQMSGNVVLLAVRAAAGQGRANLFQAFVIAMFFVGLVVSGALIELGMRIGRRRVLALALLLEFLLLLVFAVAGAALLQHGSGDLRRPGVAVFAFGAVLAFAMGAQNTSLRMAGILGFYTTHVTGTMTAFSEELVVAMFRLGERIVHPGRTGRFAAANLQARHRVAPVNLGLSFALLAGFFAGALGAALLAPKLAGPYVMAAPLAIVLAICLWDVATPFAEIPAARGEL